MKNMMTIFRREFATYFNSPIGYIYIITVLFINSIFTLLNFFVEPTADMRETFRVLPYILCVFVPLITMRLWAEDRKDNTIEMLLTFPMKPQELVLGKYFASLAFFIVTLAGTLTFPLMLANLDTQPDWGVIWSSYMGAILIGAFFLSVGIFLSGLVKDQIIAAVLSFAGCFAFFLIGTDFIALSIDSRFSGLGSALKEFLGVTPHYISFIKGIISFGDILFFLIWISLFLFLNGLYLEGRNRVGAKLNFSVAVILCVMIGLLSNFIVTDLSLGRLDCTESKIYTVSESTIKILKKLKVPVTVNIYITPRGQMPTQLKNLEQDITDKLKEMQIYSTGKLAYKTIYLKVKNLVGAIEGLSKGKKTNKSKEEILFAKGIKPVSVRILRGDKSSTQLIYSSIGIAYKDKKEEILPLGQRTLFELEYNMMSKIHRMARERKPKIVIVAPVDKLPMYMVRLYMQMKRPVPPPQDPYKPLSMILEQEGFEVIRIHEISRETPLPEKYDAMLVINPRKLGERQKWEISRAIYSGKNVMFAVQQYDLSYQASQGRIAIRKRDEEPQINTLLKAYGVEVSKNYLMDKNNLELTMRPSNIMEALTQGSMALKLPNHVMVYSSQMNKKVSITNRLSEIPYIWGTALELDKKKIEKNKLTLTKLFHSSKNSWEVDGKRNLTSNQDFKEPGDKDELKSYPLMVMLEGKFPEVYKGSERPKWPKKRPSRFNFPPKPQNDKPEGPVKKVKAAKAKVLIIGCSSLFRESFLRSSMVFFLNCVDSIALSSDLIKIRSHTIINRSIDKIKNKGMWKFINYALMPLIFLLIGLMRSNLRRIARNRYTAEWEMSS